MTVISTIGIAMDLSINPAIDHIIGLTIDLTIGLRVSLNVSLAIDLTTGHRRDAGTVTGHQRDTDRTPRGLHGGATLPPPTHRG
eukprot:5793513-Pyramimonas_sp.AAC.1